MAVNRKSEQLIGTFVHFNTLKAKQNRGNLPNDTVKYIFFNKIAYLKMKNIHPYCHYLYDLRSLYIYISVSDMIYNLYHYIALDVQS